MMDLVTFRIEVISPVDGQVDATVTNTWVFLRSGL